MSMIAFNFTNISAERRVGRVAKYSIKNSTNIVEVKEMPLGKQKALLFVFKNTVDYEPGVGTIALSGDVLFLSSDEEAKKVVEQFAKTKKIDTKYSEAVYNAILSRSTVQSLVLARDVGLPAPIQMPRVKASPAAAAPAKAATPAAPKKK